MKGGVGTSTRLVGQSKADRKLFRKACNRARNRARSFNGQSAIGKSKIPDGKIVVVPARLLTN